MFKLKVYTNNGLFYDGEISSLTIKAIDGYVTILENHAPLTSVARISPFHFIDKNKKKSECFISRGVFYVSNNCTYIVADNVYFIKDVSRLLLEQIQKKIKIEIDKYNDKHYSAMLRSSLKDARNLIRKKYN